MKMDESPKAASSLDLLPRDLAAKLDNLDGLVLILQEGVSGNTPWNRQLLANLHQADKCVQILRMTLTMLRPSSEIAQASTQLRSAVALMDASGAGGRTDLTLRAALRLMHRHAKDLDRHFHGLGTSG